MPELATAVPARRPELVIRPLGEKGRYVVKDPHTGEYYTIGEQECFLLEQLDGRRSAAEICAAFQARFDESLTPEELGEFVGMARARNFLQEPRVATAEQAVPAPRRRQSILYWRKSVFDPDRLFTWLEPKLRFCWTSGFLVVSLGCILAAAALTWSNRHELVSHFSSALRWETLLLAWLTLALVTTCHEFAHGLTCKHHGGEVHEVGFLLLLFLPCFYCNVSDAWLFKEKSKRLWVMLAGGYIDLVLWALAVFVWRLTMQDSMINYLAWVALTVCGGRIFFNFNPLLKLDGYYLLSDWLEIPNLRQRAWGRWMGHVRWVLWGAARPVPEPRSGFLLVFGATSWLYTIFFLTLMLFGLGRFLGARLGYLGWGSVALLGLVLMRGLFQGLSNGEVVAMFKSRLVRVLGWLVVLGGLAAVLCLVEADDPASGTFRVRPVSRAEVRAPVAGFLREVSADEGDRVSAGALVVRLEVPDLATRLSQKQAEVRESRARILLLKTGPRPEEVEEQYERVKRTEAWRDLGEKDLKRAGRIHEAELDRLEKQIAARQAEMEGSRDNFQRVKTLVERGTLSEGQYEEARSQYQATQARLAEAQAAKRAQQAKGTVGAETELARREKELADARATHRLLESGGRPEEVEAERARLARLQEEIRHLEEQGRKQAVPAPVSGLVTTARLREKVGQYFKEGELICVVEETAALEVEITLAEEDVARVQAGQEVKLKARALPFETYETRVERIAPAAGRGDVQSSVTVYGRFEQAPKDLRPEMTGHARVSTGRRPVGAIVLDRGLRFVRTEFWW